jgi:2-C-methyl-D-erythritol 4-phosphate cytidylyltransferase
VIDADPAIGGVGVVIVAGGAGTRLGAEVPKAFVRVGGRSLLSYAVERVANVPGLMSLVVVAPASHLEEARDVVSETSIPAGFLAAPSSSGASLPAGSRPPASLPAGSRPPASASTLEPGRSHADATVVAGGAERSDSVRIGLAQVDPTCDVVLIHDAARCLTPVAVFERVVAAVRAGAAGAVPGMPVVDTIKSVDASGVITGTPNRASLRAVQTPQGFDAKVLRAAYASGMSATDDAALVEALGHHVRVVEGDPLAFKVTTPEDLARMTAQVDGTSQLAP